MNSYLVILKGTNKQLAIEEFSTLFRTYFEEDVSLTRIENRIYEFKTNQELGKDCPFFSRLTLTNYIGKLFFTSKTEKELEENINSVTLDSIEDKTFALRVKRSHRHLDVSVQEKALATILWEKLGGPKVDLESAQEQYDVLCFEDQFSFCYKLYENEKDYLRRMPVKRPVQMPYTLKSDMARASVNLLAIKEGIVLDPFCGVGGITLEAYDMGFDVLANDISWNDLKYYKENIQYFFPSIEPKRTLADSRTQYLKDNSIDGIVSDIPYGKASRKLGLELYEKFLRSSQKMLKDNGRMVIIFANFVEFKDLALEYFNEVVTINQYINKSMTRHILVLENSKLI